MIAPGALPVLWKIAHDTTEIPAGEFLEELKALPVLTATDDAGHFSTGIALTQQSLSNYVKRGWIQRRRVTTAPGGRGQTGYFERRVLISVLAAQEFLVPREHDKEAMKRVAAVGDEPKGKHSYPRVLKVLLETHWQPSNDATGGRAYKLKGAWRSSPEFDLIAAHIARAGTLEYLARLLEGTPEDLDYFVAGKAGRDAIVDLRALLERAKTTPVVDRWGEAWGVGGWPINALLDAWLTSTPGA